MPNLQFIYLLKMYHNPFTLFLIAGEAHAKCQCCAILAILPFVTLLIAKDETLSAKLVQAILLSYLFSCILLNLSAFSISFLPISSRTQKHNFLFSFLYIILLLSTTKFIPLFSPEPS